MNRYTSDKNSDLQEKLLSLNSDFFISDLEKKAVPSRIEWPLIKSILIETGNRIICFDYSAALVVLLYAIGQLKDDQGDNTHYKAAAPLIIYSFNLGASMTMYPVISYIKPASRFEGEMQSINDDARSEIIQKYSRLPKNTFVVSAPFMLAAMAAVYYADQFWEKLGENSDVTHLVAQFSRPGALLMPVFLLQFLGELILFLRGKGKFVAKVSLSSLFIGLLLADTLTFNFFGQLAGPNLGISGLVLGISAQMLLNGLTLTSCIAISSEFREFNFRSKIIEWVSEDWKQIKELTPLALAYESTLIAELSTQLVTSRLAGSLGVNQLAAWNYVAEINFIGSLWFHSIGQVMQQMVGTPLGKNDKVLAKKMAKHGLAVSLLFPLPNLFFLALIVYPRLLTMMDTNAPNAEVQDYAETLIRSAAGIAWLYNGQFTMIESLKQTSDYQRPVYLSIGSLWLGAIASYFLSKTQNVYGVIVGSGIGGGLGFLSVLPFWIKHFGRSSVSDIKAVPLTSPTAQPLLEPASEERTSSSWCSCFSRIKRRFWSDVEMHPRSNPSPD